MRYRYLDDFRRGISVFAIFSYGIAVLGTPQCPPHYLKTCVAVMKIFVQSCDANEKADKNATAISHALCSDTRQTQTQ